MTKCEGAWDINPTVISKSNFKLNKFLNDFLSTYSQYIAEKHVFVTTEIHYFKRGFWLNKPTSQIVSSGGEIEKKLDKLDQKIIRMLSSNARISNVNIGLKLKTNPKKIAYRVKKLEKENLIQGYRILIDFAKIGYKFYKIWFSLKFMNKENFQKLLEYFKRHPNIIWVTRTIGFYDLSIEIEVKNVETFISILNEIKEKFSSLIKKHESLLIFEEGVMNYLP